MSYETLKKYSKEKEPTKYEKSYARRNDIELQEVNAKIGKSLLTVKSIIKSLTIKKKIERVRYRMYINFF